MILKTSNSTSIACIVMHWTQRNVQQISTSYIWANANIEPKGIQHNPKVISLLIWYFSQFISFVLFFKTSKVDVKTLLAGLFRGKKREKEFVNLISTITCNYNNEVRAFLPVDAKKSVCHFVRVCFDSFFMFFLFVYPLKVFKTWMYRL